MATDFRSLYASIQFPQEELEARHDELADGFLRILEPLHGRRILDLGCGSATLAVELAARGFDVTGLDLYIEPARQRAAARGVTLSLLEQDMSDMHFSQQFDAVVNWDVSGIGLFPTDEANIAVISKVREALVPGGKFLLETYNPSYIRRNPRKLEGLVFDADTCRCNSTITQTMPDGSRRSWDLSIRLFSLQEWQDILARTGFVVLGSWGSRSQIPVAAESHMLVVLAARNDGP